MDYNNMRVAELKSLARERGLRGYSRLRKSGLIDMIRNNPPPPVPQPTSSKYAKFKSYQLRSKRDKRSEPFLEPPVEQTPPGPATADRRAGLRQRGASTSGDPKKLKRMKKKLDELNRKIRHCRKEHDGMIHKRNSLRKAIEIIKHGTKPAPLSESEFIFNPIQAGLFWNHIGWGGGHIVPPLCFSSICYPITTKLGMLVLWHKISQKQ